MFTTKISNIFYYSETLVSVERERERVTISNFSKPILSHVLHCETVFFMLKIKFGLASPTRFFNCPNIHYQLKPTNALKKLKNSNLIRKM